MTIEKVLLKEHLAKQRVCRKTIMDAKFCQNLANCTENARIGT